LAPRAILGEDTAIRGRRARIPWACGHEAATEPQTSLPNLGLHHGSAALKFVEEGFGGSCRPTGAA